MGGFCKMIEYKNDHWVLNLADMCLMCDILVFLYVFLR